MKDSGRLLIIEDNPQDMKRAGEAARLAGFSELEGKTTVRAAQAYLEQRLAEGSELPDGIVLDLDFGHESGYELLRYWHSSAKLRTIPMIVWSQLGEEQRKICTLFKVQEFVGKWQGNDALEAALQRIGQG